MKFTEVNLAQAPLNRREDWASLRMSDTFEKGLVSVIVPTYNRAAFLPEAIDSILNQTYRPIELLIVDDGSNDRTAEVIRGKFSGLPAGAGFSATYLRQPNRGASAARNQGLLRSRGEFIQYLDSDDVLFCHKIARHVSALSDDSLDLVWSKWLVLPSSQLQTRLREINEVPSAGPVEPQLTEELPPWEPWPTLTRRRFLASHPLWNEHVSRWDDWEFSLRQLVRQPRRAVVPGLGCIQRAHELGRLQDLDFDPRGVEVGLTACREAAKACSELSPRNGQIRQLVAERFWGTGLEALACGTSPQAKEAFRSAARAAARTLFWVKTEGAWLAMNISGRRLTKLLLSGYLPHRRTSRMPPV